MNIELLVDFYGGFINVKSLINFFLVAALPAIMVACGGAANEADVPPELGSKTQVHMVY